MCTDSLHYDAQNSLEKMLAAFTHAQARVSTVWGVGQVESEKTISPVQAVIDNEVIGSVRRYLKGFPVDEESLAVEEVRKAGIIGSFLDTEHTFAHFRDSIYEPELLVREQRASSGEGDCLVVRAEAMVEDILSAPTKPLLGKQEERELLRIEKHFSS